MEDGGRWAKASERSKEPPGKAKSVTAPKGGKDQASSGE